MTDEPLTLRQWTDVVRRCRLGRTAKAVALVLATYADSDGTRVFPGLARIAVDAEVSYNVAQTALTKLRKVGLVEQVGYGARRRGSANEYRLILAPDLLDRVDVLTPAQVRLEADRKQATHSGDRSKTKPGPDQEPLDLGPTTPAPEVIHRADLGPTPCAPENDPNEDLGPTPRAPKQPDAESFGANGVSNSPRFGANGVSVLGPTACVPTIHDHATTTTSHPDSDLHAAVTHPRDTEPNQDPDSPRLPDRCPHGLRARQRPDGTSTCALCRLTETTTAALPATA